MWVQCFQDGLNDSTSFRFLFFPIESEEFISSVAGAQPLLHFYFCFHFCVSRLLVTSQFKPHNV